MDAQVKCAVASNDADSLEVLRTLALDKHEPNSPAYLKFIVPTKILNHA